MLSAPRNARVSHRRQTERGGRTANPIRQTAETSRNEFATACGTKRRSIHHRLASKPAQRILPRRLNKANPPRNKASPRGSAFQTKDCPFSGFIDRSEEHT